MRLSYLLGIALVVVTLGTAHAQPADKGRLYGKIVFAWGSDAVREPFVEVFAGSEPRDNEESVEHAWASEPKFDLKPGAYRLRVQTDAVDRTFVFGVEAGKTLDMEFSLEAGIAAFEAPEGWTTIDIKGTEKGIYGDAKDITSITPPVAAFALPAGKYLAVAEKDGDKKELEFEIVAGKRTVVKIQ